MGSTDSSIAFCCIVKIGCRRRRSEGGFYPGGGRARRGVVDVGLMEALPSRMVGVGNVSWWRRRCYEVSDTTVGGQGVDVQKIVRMMVDW